ncbi:MAG: DUF4301 family protein [Tannerella sp.]|nr:DUF4301 family protein [Tannerella sp.]
MLTNNDRQQLAEKNISEEAINEQLACFAQGFGFLDVKIPATIKRGIKTISASQCADYIQKWDDYLQKDKTIFKFVPASGAASRMFKNLFTFLSADYQCPTTDFEKLFFERIAHFAFYEALDEQCRQNEGKDIQSLTAKGNYKIVVKNLLETKGLGYGALPKGLLAFHQYAEGARTSLEEHLVEGALYAKNKMGKVNLHLTVSAGHLPLFEKTVAEKCKFYEQKFNVNYVISFSTQDPSTDTIAVDMDNRPFREADGSLMFRPGGHGALIGNLNQIDADVVFIKNIDNVMPDHLKDKTVMYKKVLAGVLVDIREKIFDYLELIERGDYSHRQVEEMIYFLQNELCIKNPETKLLEDAELILYLKRKLLRPLRICGMVLNDGEPGGGPFFAVNPDGTFSLQIVEQSQLDKENPGVQALYASGTHFNPVDLVCALKRPDGTKYHLPDYVDKNTGFISKKSKDGSELKALELPGLWNGSMSDWNTVFVEVPIETFNPVKTVNDLLKPQHQ